MERSMKNKLPRKAVKPASCVPPKPKCFSLGNHQNLKINHLENEKRKND